MFIHKPFLGSMWGLIQNLGPIGSAVLSFIGYKNTDIQTEKQSIYFKAYCLQNKKNRCREAWMLKNDWITSLRSSRILNLCWKPVINYSHHIEVYNEPVKGIESKPYDVYNEPVKGIESKL